MFIVILGWLYVIAMVAITAPSVGLGVVIFVGGGLGPALLVLYIAGSRIRRVRALRREHVATAAADVTGATGATGTFAAPDREIAPPPPSD
ncbi:hypothetical protein [Pandoraea sp.]|uniref:hypothetical protein n=1 Tax=Pandoraea sp. TaxID=1883445 RepID=UPI0035B145F5